MLSATIVERLRAEKPLVCYYHFSKQSKAAANRSFDAYRAILAQVLRYAPAERRLKNHFLFAMYFGSDGQMSASSSEVGELFEVSMSLLSQTRLYLVLDGLDECEDLDSELIPTLRNLSQRHAVHMVLLSRETIRYTMNSLEGVRTVHMALLNLQDIQLYLRAEIRSLVDKRRLPQ